MPCWTNSTMPRGKNDPLETKTTVDLEFKAHQESKRTVGPGQAVVQVTIHQSSNKIKIIFKISLDIWKTCNKLRLFNFFYIYAASIIIQFLFAIFKEKKIISVGLKLYFSDPDPIPDPTKFLSKEAKAKILNKTLARFQF